MRNLCQSVAAAFFCLTLLGSAAAQASGTTKNLADQFPDGSPTSHIAPPAPPSVDVAPPAALPPPPPVIQEEPAAPASSATHADTKATAKNYTLASGDHIHLIVYGEDDLSGDYIVGESGAVALPLIGNVQAAGTNEHQLESAILAKLSNGYLHDPKVSIQLLNYRPFFILGEVAKPGSYPYVDGMNVLNAVALAGGYTYRASTGRIKIIHGSAADKKEMDAAETESVMPGDIIKVPERYF